MEITKTIKGKEVIAYKGMNSDMSCGYFQYEIGKTYKTDKAEFCVCGFHACLNPRDVLDYYSQRIKSRYFKVKLSGEITKCDFEDTQVAATEITIIEEINIDEVIETTEWWKNNNVLDLLYWSDDFAKVQRGDGLYNFIDKQGNTISNEWFYYLDSFHDGFAVVQREDRFYNFIDRQGNFLSKEWYKYIYYFHEGFAAVERENGLRNFIDKQGNIISNEWFNWTDNFHEGFAIVKRTNCEWAKIDKTGNIWM